MSDVAPQDQVSRGLLIALGAVAIAAVMFLLIGRPLLFGEETEPAPILPRRTTTTDTATDPLPATGQAPAPLDEVDFQVFSGARDPFQQLVAQSTAAAGTATTGTATTGTTPTGTTPTGSTTTTTTPNGSTTTTTTTGSTGSTTTSPSSSPSPATTGATSQTSAGADRAGTTRQPAAVTPDQASDNASTVRLVDTFTGTDGRPEALVTVNSSGYRRGEGERFAQGYQVVDIDGRCSTLRSPNGRFVLCQGERIQK